MNQLRMRVYFPETRSHRVVHFSPHPRFQFYKRCFTGFKLALWVLELHYSLRRRFLFQASYPTSEFHPESYVTSLRQLPTVFSATSMHFLAGSVALSTELCLLHWSSLMPVQIGTFILSGSTFSPRRCRMVRASHFWVEVKSLITTSRGSVDLKVVCYTVLVAS
jgi:hypothetical protein